MCRIDKMGSVKHFADGHVDGIDGGTRIDKRSKFKRPYGSSNCIQVICSDLDSWSLYKFGVRFKL